MESVRKIAERKIWNYGRVELWDFAHANRNALTREETLSFLLRNRSEAKLLLSDPQEARRQELPLSVLEFIRFGGLMGRREESLRFQPHLAFWSANNEERWRELKEYRETVATFRLTVPSFVLEDIAIASNGLSFYIPNFPLENKFWEPNASLTTHFILRDENRRQWRTFEKLLRLDWSLKKARLFLGANFYRRVWLQGDRDSFSQLFREEGFSFSQTFKVVSLMNRLERKRQTQPSLFDFDGGVIH